MYAWVATMADRQVVHQPKYLHHVEALSVAGLRDQAMSRKDFADVRLEAKQLAGGDQRWTLCDIERRASGREQARHSCARPPADSAALRGAQLRGDLGRRGLDVGREPAAERILARSVLGQDVARDAIAPGEREQQMLRVGAALTTDALRLLYCHFQDAFGARRDAEGSRVARAAAPDDPLDRLANPVLADAELRECRSREARLGAEGEQQMLGTEVTVAEAARLLSRPCDDPARRLVEVLGPRERRSDEALVGGLLRHAERRADLGPRRPVGARGLDVAVEQLVAETAQLVRRGGRGAQATENARRRVGFDRCGQLLECQAGLDTVKVPLTDLSVKASLTRAASRSSR